MRAMHVVGLAFTLQLAIVPSARAQPPVDTAELWDQRLRPQVAELLERAQKAEHDGDIHAAIELYEQATERCGECGLAGVEFGLALLRAGRTLAGARQLRATLMLSPGPHSQRSSEYIYQKLEEAKQKIGTLIIRTNADRVTLEVDGENRWEYPRIVEVYVDPEKEHKIVARRDGYWTAYTTEKVRAGEVKDVLMAMEPQVMQKVINLPTRMTANVSTQLPQEEESKTLLYVSAAGVGISLAAGGIGGIVLYNSEKETDPGAYSAGLGLVAGGVIGMGLSLTGLIVYGMTPRPQPQPIITISPALAKNQVGLGLSGTW